MSEKQSNKAKARKVPSMDGPVLKPPPGGELCGELAQPMAECESDCITQEERAPCSPCGSCQVLCQTTCQVSCQSTCQKSCQTGCQVSCTSTCQVSCQTACELSCQVGCEVDCMDGCQMTCEFSCEVGCQDYCETHCQVGCTTCQSSCQLSCQTTCQQSCQSTCQLDCQDYCEDNCTSTCQMSCQNPCEYSCVYSCEVGCQELCEVQCQGCLITCQETCEVSCTVGCEVTCTIGCEVSCTEICEFECTDRCEATCTVGCEISCTTGCEVNCTTGCEVNCTIGCEVNCTIGCEVNCTIGCEVNCTAGCEVNCTTGCEVECQDECLNGTCGETCVESCGEDPPCGEGSTGIKILVDPGHGGTDPGAIGVVDGWQVMEKDLALNFALGVKQYLESHAGVTAVLTRTQDEDVSLQTRWQMGRDNGVQGVISIHFNASSDPTVSGIETFYAENRTELPPYGDREFADAVHTGVLEQVPFLVNRGVKAADYDILVQPEGPAYPYPRCMVKIEYLSNSTAMEALISSPTAIEDVARGITNGVRTYFDEEGTPYREVSRVYGSNTVLFNYAVCRPEDIDILWSSTPKVLSTLMDDYPGYWIRASNCAYFDWDFNTVGYVLKSGTVVHQAVREGLEFDGWWVDYDGNDHFVRPVVDFLDSVDLERCKLGINVGPLLVVEGQPYGFDDRMGWPYSGLRHDSVARRIGIGWSRCPDRIIHVFTNSEGCTLYNLQDFFMEFPGIWAAMAFDGGGSEGVIDKDIGQGVMGSNERPMQTAFVIRRKSIIPLHFRRD